MPCTTDVERNIDARSGRRVISKRHRFDLSFIGVQILGMPSQPFNVDENVQNRGHSEVPGNGTENANHVSPVIELLSSNSLKYHIYHVISKLTYHRRRRLPVLRPLFAATATSCA